MSQVKADDMLLFVQVVEAGSFAKVAKQLEVTNSVVSKRITRLEAALDTQLLYRTTRKLSLTDPGSALFKKAKLASTALQEAQEALQGYRKTIGGKVKITIPSVSAHFVLNQALANFCMLYPDISLDITIADHFIDLVEEGYDLAIRTGELESSSLIARRLIDSHWVVVASQAYLEQHGSPLEPRDLQYHNCLVYENNFGGANMWRFSLGGVESAQHVGGQMVCNSMLSLKEAVLNDLGVAYLPHVAVSKELQSGKLVKLLPQYKTKSIGIYAVFPHAKQPVASIKLLIEHVRHAYQSQAQLFSLKS